MAAKKRVLLLPALILAISLTISSVVFAAVHFKFEAESGTNTGDVSVISDTSASGGSALKFNEASTGDSFADVPSNFNTDDWLQDDPWPIDDSSWEPSGSFRFTCSFSHLGYFDPIVYPGQANKGHLHMFFGNKSLDHSSTYQSLRSAGDGSCVGGPLNRTGYWMPAVFDRNDGNKVVVPSFFNLYYKDSPCPYAATSLSQKQACIRNVHDIPNGLRIIAGYDVNGPADQNRHMDWYCDTTQNKSGNIPNSCPPGEALIAAVYFPTCWDGVNLDSPNHRSHMAYIYYDPNDGQPRCPTTHPVHLPALTEFAFWNNAGNTSGWTLSSDNMPGMTHTDGSTFHADWFGAWDNSVMDAWTQNCIRNMKNVSNGRLCNGKMLKEPAGYSGPMRISGYADYFK